MAVRRAESVTVRGRTVTATAVEAAMTECDRLGQEAFLAQHGYQAAHRYWLRGPVSHRRYPTKAILGVAAGLEAADFFGGAAHTVAALQRLGFEVREGEEPVKALGLEALRAQAVAAGFADPAPGWENLPVTPVAVFASGSNRTGEIRGMARVGMDVGVAAPHVSPTSEAELVKLSGTDVQVFVDSGAFSEVEWSEAESRLVPVHQTGSCACQGPTQGLHSCGISDAEWLARLGLYQRLAEKLGPQAWLVAPDQVGSQEVTLERLTRYAPQLQALARTGAKLLVVAQKGAMSQADFFRAAVSAAGLSESKSVVAALPCKKAATTPSEVTAFLRDAQPKHVHLLGKGPGARDVSDYLAPFAGEVDGHPVEASVSLDSCWITANAGRANGRQGAPRRYTLAQDMAGRALAAAGRITSAVSKAAHEVALRLELALLLCLGAPLPVTVTVEPVQRELFAA